MSGKKPTRGGKRSVNYVAPEDPPFIKKMKEQLGYKPPTIDDKRTVAEGSKEPSTSEGIDVNLVGAEVVVVSTGTDLTLEQAKAELIKRQEKEDKEKIAGGEVVRPVWNPELIPLGRKFKKPPVKRNIRPMGDDKTKRGHGQGGSGNDKTKPIHDQGHSGNDKTKPGHNQGHSGDDKTKPGHGQGHSANDKTKPGDDQGHGGDDKTKPGDDQGHSGNDKTKPGDDQGHSGNDKTKPGDDQERKCREGDTKRPPVNDPKPGVNANLLSFDYEDDQ